MSGKDGEILVALQGPLGGWQTKEEFFGGAWRQGYRFAGWEGAVYEFLESGDGVAKWARSGLTLDNFDFRCSPEELAAA